MSARSVFAFGALMIALAVQPARAHDVESESILICDTQQQAERFVSLHAKNEKTALAAVNAEASNPTACAFADVAFVRGARIGIVGAGKSAFAIVPVIALGVNTPAGTRPVPPAPYYMLVPVREFAV